MTGSSLATLEELKDILVGTGVGESDHSGALARLAELRQDPRILQVLHEICEECRSKLVIYGAIRIACDVDRQRAVLMATGALQRLSSRIAGPIAKLLAERCRDEALPAMIALSRSPRLQHRLTSLVFLRCLRADACVPVFIDMYRTEKNSMALRLLRRLLSKRLRAAHVGRLEKLVGELTWKLEDLSDLIQGALSKTAPTRAFAAESSLLVHKAVGYALAQLRAGGTSRSTPPVGQTQALVPAATRDGHHDDLQGRPAGLATTADRVAASDELRKVPLSPPEAPGSAGDQGHAQPAGPAPRPGVGAQPTVSASVPISTPPRGLPTQPEASFRSRMAPFGALMPAVVVIAALTALSGWVVCDSSRHSVNGGEQRRANPGRVGGRTEFTGVIVSVVPKDRTVEMRTDRGLTVAIRFPDREVGDLASGRTITVGGIIRDLPSDKRVRILGFSVTPR